MNLQREKIVKDVAPATRGVLFCRECGFKLISGGARTETYLKNGWPKCCDQTMRLITDKQLRTL